MEKNNNINWSQIINKFLSWGTVSSANFNVESLVSKWKKEGKSEEFIARALTNLDHQ